MKIVSTETNYLVQGLWLPLGEGVEVAEVEIAKYLALDGVKALTDLTPVAVAFETEANKAENAVIQELPNITGNESPIESAN